MMKKRIRTASLMYDTPTNYQEARDYYRSNLQDKLDGEVEFATNNKQIEEEQTFGLMDFDNIMCRITHLINPSTGLNVGEDFKRLLFWNINHQSRIGMRYRFDDNIWMVTNMDRYRYDSSHVDIRRCNNTLKYIIKSTGEIIEEPCIIDYRLNYSNLYFNEVQIVPQGSIKVWLQLNQNTKGIDINDRFVYADQVWKVKSKKNMMRERTYDPDSVALLELEMSLDSIGPYDDMENGIASRTNPNDGKEPTPTPTPPPVIFFNLQPNISEVLKGDTQIFVCRLEIGRIVQTDTMTFTVLSGPDKARYDFTVLDGNRFQITNKQMDLKNPLVIKCDTGLYSQEFSITLAGMF